MMAYIRRCLFTQLTTDQRYCKANYLPLPNGPLDTSGQAETMAKRPTLPADPLQ